MQALAASCEELRARTVNPPLASVAGSFIGQIVIKEPATLANMVFNKQQNVT
jgi:hypothetical protein